MVARGLTDSWVQGDWLVQVVLVTAAGINPTVQPKVVLVTAAGINPTVQPTCVRAGLRCWARGCVSRVRGMQGQVLPADPWIVVGCSHLSDVL